MTRALFPLLLVCAAGVCGGAHLRAAEPAHAVTVEMRQQTFVPATLDVAPGTTIEWVNRDSMPHSVTADGRFDSGPIQPGKSFRWTAQSAGKIAYRCIFHPSMTATLVVGTP